ncbi:hypothetical protein ACV566_01750 [Staphylococcus aureus]
MTTQLNINSVIENAKRVITLNFAAQSMGRIKADTFEDVAKWLHNHRDVDIFPNKVVIESAVARGRTMKVSLINLLLICYLNIITISRNTTSIFILITLKH